MKCDMCANIADFHDITDEKLDLCNPCYQTVCLSQDFAKFKAWWIKENTAIKHAIQTAIGVRNNKIKEQAGRITILEKQLKNLVEKVDCIYNVKEIN